MAPSECGLPLAHSHRPAKDIKLEPAPHQRNLKAHQLTSAAILLVVSACLLVFADPVQRKLINLVKWHGLSRECFLWNICGKNTTPTFPPNCLQDSDWKTTEAAVHHGLEDASSSKYVSYTTLNIPLPTGEHSLISFNSHSSQSGGSFSIITSPNQPKDTITFNISRRHTPEVARFASICFAPETAMNDGHYVWITTPYHPLARALVEEQPHFYAITMILPESEDGSVPLQIPNFQTRFIDTMQKIGDIGSKVFFGHISLNSNGPSPIDAVSLTGRSIEIHSNGGPITGTFSSTEALHLNTFNAPIKVDVNLNHSFPRSSLFVPAETSNSPIHAAYGQDAIKENDYTAGIFSVSAQTTNSRIEVEFKTAPVGSLLSAKISTSNSPARVIAHPTYQGALHLSATFSTAKIEDTHPDDPSGQARPRHIQYNEIESSVLNGVTYWGDSDSMYPYGLPMYGSSGIDHNGRSITISTVKSPVILVL